MWLPLYVPTRNAALTQPSPTRYKRQIASINNILLTMGLLTIWRLFLLLFVSKLIRAYLKERISLKEVGSGRNTVFADLHVIAADYVVDHLFEIRAVL